jgi:hypothetical protein
MLGKFCMGTRRTPGDCKALVRSISTVSASDSHLFVGQSWHYNSLAILGASCWTTVRQQFPTPSVRSRLEGSGQFENVNARTLLDSTGREAEQC